MQLLPEFMNHCITDQTAVTRTYVFLFPPLANCAAIFATGSTNVSKSVFLAKLAQKLAAIHWLLERYCFRKLQLSRQRCHRDFIDAYKLYLI